jgi:hypothetical protein
LEKKFSRYGGYFCNLKKGTQSKQSPIVENSPYLVTLLAVEATEAFFSQRPNSDRRKEERGEKS